MKIAITGANGFLGRALTNAAKRQGIDVAVHFGPPPANDVVASNHRQEVDICDVNSLALLFAGSDAIVHLAGPSDVASSFRDPVETTRAHVSGTAAVLYAAQRSQVGRLIYISSAEVYGRTDSGPIKETAALLPLSPYGAAKAAAELLVAAALRRGGLDNAVMLRPFSIYGPGGRRTSVLGRMLAQIRRREQLRVFSTRPVRDYVHVADAVAAILSALSYDASDLLTANIASGQGISVGDLAGALAALTGTPAGVIETPDADRPLSHDITHLVGDASVAESELGWRPTIDLATGLRQCLDAVEEAS
jgi:nucleoside-diphosphate-sugar epimerase